MYIYFIIVQNSECSIYTYSLITDETYTYKYIYTYVNIMYVHEYVLALTWSWCCRLLVSGDEEISIVDGWVIDTWRLSFVNVVDIECQTNLFDSSLVKINDNSCSIIFGSVIRDDLT